MRLVLSLLLAFLTPASNVASWDGVAQRTAAASVFLTLQFNDGTTGTCTGFVINDVNHYVMTAAHCFADHILADGTPASVTFYSSELDTMVLWAPGVSKRALRPGRKPRVGEGVGAFGWAWGAIPQFRVAWIASVDVEVESQDPPMPGRWIVLGMAIIPGMSGGPMVDRDGRVVSVNQITSAESAFGHSIDDIYSATTYYWRHKR